MRSLSGRVQRVEPDIRCRSRVAAHACKRNRSQSRDLSVNSITNSEHSVDTVNFPGCPGLPSLVRRGPSSGRWSSAFESISIGTRTYLSHDGPVAPSSSTSLFSGASPTTRCRAGRASAAASSAESRARACKKKAGSRQRADGVPSWRAVGCCGCRKQAECKSETYSRLGKQQTAKKHCARIEVDRSNCEQSISATRQRRWRPEWR